MPRRPLWSTWRKAWGNILPLVLIAGPLGMTLRELAQEEIRWQLALWLGITLVVGWISICLFGLAGNGALKQRMGKKLHDARPFDKGKRWFVGFARPKYRGLLDAHEDVGFLCLHSDRIEFFGDQRQIELMRSSIRKISFRPNPHTVLGLGRWISIDAENQGKAVRMLIEPREKMTLFGNLLFSRKMIREIREWARMEAPRG